ncbi:AIR synthase family protein [Halobacteria archaeon AArc-dxtr1]|nr:AIR synthase family protein [Halobacteria archaeon AArc-dxtr1]
MPGKARPSTLLEHVFDRTGAPDDAVLQGPADGEDAAAIDWPGGTLVVSSDPISLAASQVATLGVHVACNDVAVAGADPRWLTVVALLPEATDDAVTQITRDLDVAARDVGVAIVGGHTESVDALSRPLLSLTAMGATDRFVPTGGAEPGDRLLLTKGAGLEGTAILATDFGDALDVDRETRDRAETFLEEVSVVPDARIVREHATAMHDPTEGGVLAGLLELARASDCRLAVEREAVPVRDATRQLCEAADVDPLRIFGSGAVLATVPESAHEACLDALSAAGIDAATIGTVEAGESALILDGEAISGPVEDDLYPLWADVDANADS